MSEFDSSLTGQRQQRLAKLNELVGLGINPYPAKSKKTHPNAKVTGDFANLEGKEVTLSGRIMTWREHGSVRFADLQDASGQIQLYFKVDEFGKLDTDNQTLGWEQLNLIDVGDFIEATGIVTKTQRGEISLLTTSLKILVKTIRPLPTKGEGLKDKEERFRRRYVDMAVNPEVRHFMERRAAFWQAHRDFFNKKGFHEVNIPILEHIPGGGDAVPFMTHMNAIDEDFYLRISHELPLKRLVGAGFEKVYDIGARFRNEGLSDEHLPEHVAMEFYWAYADWQDGMEFVKEMYDFIIRSVYGEKRKFNIRGFEVNFDKGWEIMDFAEIMEENFGIKNFYDPDLEQLKKLLEENDINYDPETINVPRAVDSLWKKLRKTVAGPAFLINHPKYLSPLQKPSLTNPLMVERMQPIIAGSELGNGWSEVNDPIDQYNRFVEQQEMRKAGDDEAQWLDIDYVEMLEYGMAPTFGWGHSERLFWFLEDVTAREGVPFPQLKFHISDTTKEIYPEIDFSTIREAEADSNIKSHDHSQKMVLVLNQELEGWQLTNTVGQLTAYLGAEIGRQNLRTRQNFELAADAQIPANAQYAVISMKAKSSTQLYNLLQKVEETDLVHLAYVQEMIDYNDDEELQAALKDRPKDQLTYLGIGIFGSKEEIDKLTKKFKLWS